MTGETTRTLTRELLECAAFVSKIGKIQDADPVGARIGHQVALPAPNEFRVEDLAEGWEIP